MQACSHTHKALHSRVFEKLEISWRHTHSAGFHQCGPNSWSAKQPASLILGALFAQSRRCEVGTLAGSSRKTRTCWPQCDPDDRVVLSGGAPSFRQIQILRRAHPRSATRVSLRIAGYDRCFSIRKAWRRRHPGTRRDKIIARNQKGDAWWSQKNVWRSSARFPASGRCSSPRVSPATNTCVNLMIPLVRSGTDNRPERR